MKENLKKVKLIILKSLYFIFNAIMYGGLFISGFAWFWKDYFETKILNSKRKQDE